MLPEKFANHVRNTFLTFNMTFFLSCWFWITFFTFCSRCTLKPATIITQIIEMFLRKLHSEESLLPKCSWLAISSNLCSSPSMILTLRNHSISMFFLILLWRVLDVSSASCRMFLPLNLNLFFLPLNFFDSLLLHRIAGTWRYWPTGYWLFLIFISS